MSDDYLWDKKGEPDPEIERLPRGGPARGGLSTGQFWRLPPCPVKAWGRVRQGND